VTAHGHAAGPIIVGYADGICCESTLRAADLEARLRETSIVIMHQLIGVHAPETFGHNDNVLGKRRAAAYQLLRTAKNVMPDIDRVQTRIVTDPIAEALVLASHTATMLVLGVTTSHASAAAAFDTVPREVSRRARCPVLLVPPGLTTEGVEIVCGIDRTPASVDALHWAASEAALRGVAVLAVDVVASAPHRGGGDDRGPLSDWVQRHVPQSATTIMCDTTYGSPAHRLLEIAEQRQGILVIGRHTRGGLARRSVARVVTAQTRVPVVVVNPHPSDEHTTQKLRSARTMTVRSAYRHR
jgi:nucleotide-binding universal stress UspA family protein